MFIISSPRPLAVCQAFSSQSPSRSSSTKPIWWSNAVPPLSFLLHTHTPPLPSFSSFAPFSLPLHCPPFSLLLVRTSFCPAGPLSGGYRVLTCLHLPPALADQWARSTESPTFRAPPFSQSQLQPSVFSTSDPRPWQQGQECQEWLAG